MNSDSTPADYATVTSFAENLKKRGKQPATIESYCRDAQRFLDYVGQFKLPLSQVEPETLLSYQKYLSEDCEERNNSVRRTVIGVRQFFRYLSEEKLIGMTPFDVVPIPSRDESLPDGLDQEDVEAALAVAGSGAPAFKARRDTAIVSLLAFEGLKANEVIQLEWSDYQTAGRHGTLKIGGTRTRVIRLNPATHAAMEEYRSAFESAGFSPRAGASRSSEVVEMRLFVAFKGRDSLRPIPAMTRHGLKFILYEIGEKAGIDRLNAEQLRHFAVTNLIAEGRTPEEIMQHLGLRRLGNIAKHFALKNSKAKDTRPALS